MPPYTKLYKNISRTSGGFAIVALDQRESLRTMFANVTQPPITDETLISFKISAAELLSPYASAMLFDHCYGMEALDVAKSTNSSCGVIVAADHLIQEPGHPVTDTQIDYAVDPQEAAHKGASAMKFMVIWKDDHKIDEYVMLAEKFLERCRSVGLLGVVEAVVRPPNGVPPTNWNRELALVSAARALGATKPDLYKTEVPFYGDASSTEIRSQCEAISNVLPCPWVVLSSGVDPQKFPEAVQAACKGGASGFLAGRGIWQDAVHEIPSEYRNRLLGISVNRLLKLTEIVDESARSWQTFYKQ